MKFLPLKGNKINIWIFRFFGTTGSDWIISNHGSASVNMTQFFSHPLISAFSTAHTECVCRHYFIIYNLLFKTIHHNNGYLTWKQTVQAS